MKRKGNFYDGDCTPWGLYMNSVVNSPSVSRRTTSRTPTVSPSRDFCEVVRPLKMKPSLYQDDFNIEPPILWIHTLHKADFWRFLLGANVGTLILFPNFLPAFPFSLLISQGHFFLNLKLTNLSGGS